MDDLRVPPSKSGVVLCLKCQNPFNSPDRICIRICPKCKRDKERLGLIAEQVSRAYGVDAYDVDGFDGGTAARDEAVEAIVVPVVPKPPATPKPPPAPKPPRPSKPKRPTKSSLTAWDF